MYATHPISPPIERQVKIAGRQCRVFHNGQNNFCKIYGLQGHRQGDVCLFDFQLKHAKMVHYNYYYHFLNMLLTLVDGNRSRRPLQCLSTI